MKWKKLVPCYIYADYRILITLVLVLLTLYNIFELGVSVLWQVLTAVITAIVVDSLIIKWRSKNWYFPSGAVISAMIIAQLISADLITVAAVVVLSLVLKWILRPFHRNLFNPAVLSVVVATLLFQYIPGVQPIFSSWWAATKYIMPALGLFLVIVIKRWNIALAFLIPYFILESFRTGIVSLLGILSGSFAYFAFIMVIEPVTTPTTNRSRIIFGVAVALLTFGFSFIPYMLANSFFLYVPLLIMNAVMRLLPHKVLG